MAHGTTPTARIGAYVAEGVPARGETAIAPYAHTYATLILAVALIVPVAHGASEVEMRIGVSHTDNLLRDETKSVGEELVVAGVTLDLSAETRRLTSFLVGDLVYQHYTSGAFDNETRPDLHGYLDFYIAPDVFSWMIEDRYGQVVTDPFGADTIFNREKVNRFSTGPNFTFEFLGQNALEITGRFIDTQFEISDSDSERTSVNVGLARSLAPNREVSVHFVSEAVNYDLPLYQDFDRREAYFQFESQISRGSLNLILGTNEVEFDAEPISRPLYSLNLNRMLTKLLTVNLAYDQRIVDASDQFGRSSSDDPNTGDSQGITPLGDIYETEEISFGIGRIKGAGQLSIGVYVAEDNYRTATNYNVMRHGMNFGYEYAFGSGWSMGISGYVENRDFENADFEDDNFEMTATLGRRFTRTLGLEFEYLRVDRDSPSESNTYTENRYSVSLTYRPTPKSESD